MKNRFDKSFRLLSANDFAHLKSGCKRKSVTWLRGYYKFSKNKKTRIGLSVSKKLGNAVLRNRVKRILRESFRMSSYKYLGIDILIVVSPKLYSNFSHIKDVENSLRKSCFHLLKSTMEVPS